LGEDKEGNKATTKKVTTLVREFMDEKVNLRKKSDLSY
jgi:hypothetical protein